MNEHIGHFFNLCESGAQGTGLGQVESRHIAMIERFIAGECNDAEHRELATFLSSNPRLIWWVAHQINENFEAARRLDGKPHWLPSAA